MEKYLPSPCLSIIVIYAPHTRDIFSYIMYRLTICFMSHPIYHQFDYQLLPSDDPLLSIHSYKEIYGHSFKNLLNYNSPTNDLIINMYLYILQSCHPEIKIITTFFSQQFSNTDWQSASSKYFHLGRGSNTSASPPCLILQY